MSKTQTTPSARKSGLTANHSQACQAVKEYLQLRGFYFHKHLGGIGQRKGLPDFDAVINGQYIAIEVKTGQGRLSAPQLDERDAILRAGGHYIVGDVEDIIEQLEAIRHECATVRAGAQNRFTCG